MHLRLPTAIITLMLAAPISAQQGGGPTDATDISANDIQAVFESLNGAVDRQIKVADVGDGNVAVGILHRGQLDDVGDSVSGLVHWEVTEVYYVMSGGGTLVTGGPIEGGRDASPEGVTVRLLVGPSSFASSLGGRTRLVSEGDIVIIPAGVFHAWREIPDHVTYLSIRPDPDAVLPAGYTNPVLAGASGG